MAKVNRPGQALLDASMAGNAIRAATLPDPSLEDLLGTRCRVGWTSLHYAAKNNMPALVLRLLGLGVPVDTPGDDDSTPLYLAAQDGAMQAAEVLVSWGASAIAGDDRGVTPCLIAAQNGHLPMLKLLAPLATAHHAHEDGTTVLLAATRSGSAECVSYLVELGADVNISGDGGTTLIMRAARKGHADIILALYEGGADAAALDEHGLSAVHYACLDPFADPGQRAAVVTLLVEGLGVDPSAHAHVERDSPTSGVTTLILAAQAGCERSIAILLASGAPVDERATAPHGPTALYVAAQCARRPAVDALLRAGAAADVLVQVPSRTSLQTPLAVAARNNATDVVRALLTAGADPAGGEGESSPLLAALSAGNMEIGALLIEAIAALPGGETQLGNAVMHAVETGSTQLLRLLLDGHPERALISVCEYTALHLAAQEGDAESCTLLVRAGADVNAVRRSDGTTPVMLAARGGHETIFACLVEAGADLNAVDSNGISVPLWAAASGVQDFADTAGALALSMLCTAPAQLDGLESRWTPQATLAVLRALRHDLTTPLREATQAIQIPASRSVRVIRDFVESLWAKCRVGVRTSSLRAVARRLVELEQASPHLPETVVDCILQVVTLAGLHVDGPAVEQCAIFAREQGLSYWYVLRDAPDSSAGRDSNRIANATEAQCAKVMRHYLEMHGGHPVGLKLSTSRTTNMELNQPISRDCIRKLIPWVNHRDIKLGGLLGAGAFGCVFSGSLTPSLTSKNVQGASRRVRDDVVIKMQVLPSKESGRQRQCWRELAVQVFLSHVVGFRLPFFTSKDPPSRSRADDQYGIKYRNLAAPSFEGFTIVPGTAAISMLPSSSLSQVSPRFRDALNAPKAEVILAAVERRAADLRSVLRALRSRSERGATLAESVLPMKDVARLALQVVHSLGQLHWARLPMLHGDIKGDNVLVDVEESSGVDAHVVRESLLARARAPDGGCLPRLHCTLADFGQCLVDVNHSSVVSDAEEAAALKEEAPHRVWCLPITPPELRGLLAPWNRSRAASHDTWKTSGASWSSQPPGLHVDIFMLGILMLEIATGLSVDVARADETRRTIPLLHRYLAALIACSHVLQSPALCPPHDCGLGIQAASISEIALHEVRLEAALRNQSLELPKLPTLSALLGQADAVKEAYEPLPSVIKKEPVLPLSRNDAAVEDERKAAAEIADQSSTVYEPLPCAAPNGPVLSHPIGKVAAAALANDQFARPSTYPHDSTSPHPPSLLTALSDQAINIVSYDALPRAMDPAASDIADGPRLSVPFVSSTLGADTHPSINEGGGAYCRAAELDALARSSHQATIKVMDALQAAPPDVGATICKSYLESVTRAFVEEALRDSESLALTDIVTSCLLLDPSDRPRLSDLYSSLGALVGEDELPQ